MIVHLARGLVGRGLALVVLSVLAFTLVHAAPGDPAAIALRAAGEEPTAEAVVALRAQLGLDRSLPEQYLAWAGRAVRLDFGRSLVSRRPVAETFLERLPATLLLAGAALALTAGAGLVGGLFAAQRPGGWRDRASWCWALLGAALPSYWLGLLLSLLFGVVLGWLPVAGAGEPRHVILPACTLAFSFAALQLRLLRAGLLGALAEPFSLVAEAKGLSRRELLWRHALPRALGVNLQALGLAAGHLLGGAVVAETVFAWPGVGRLVVESVFRRDFPIIQCYVLLIGGLYLAINLLADLLQAWADPTVRSASGDGALAD